VVAGDNDPAGRDGAAHTALALGALVPAIAMAFPPSGYKDFRDWILSGTFALTQLIHLNTKEIK
jgi:hypothetical protein